MTPVRVNKTGSAFVKRAKSEFQSRIEGFKRVASIIDTAEFKLVDEILQACEHTDYYWNHSHSDLTLQLYQYGALSYTSNDERLVRVNGALKSIDADMAPDTYKEQISHEYGNVTWKHQWDFEFKDGSEVIVVPFIVELTIHIKQDSPECRRVQIGTKEVPVFRMECAPPADVVDPAALPAPVFALEGKV